MNAGQPTLALSIQTFSSRRVLHDSCQNTTWNTLRCKKKNDLSAQVQIRVRFQWSENFVDKQHNEETIENEILIFVADDKWITNKMEWSKITYLSNMSNM